MDRVRREVSLGLLAEGRVLEKRDRGDRGLNFESLVHGGQMLK